MEPVSVYLHIPFCRHRCGYCDFNTYAGKEALIGAYAQALAQEVAYTRRGSSERIPAHSIYFGGGTPSLVPLEGVEQVFSALEDTFAIDSAAEITLEVNPGTVDLAYMQGLKSLGVNRISMGVQSANPVELRILERQHGYGDAIQAVKYARQAGFDNLSIDLIFGLPGQGMASWKHNLELGLGLNPEHISLYALTIEFGTPLEKMIERGLLQLPDNDLAGDMYEWTMDRLQDEGLIQYEISNWARRDAQGQAMLSRHNSQYWLNRPYFGFGAGAHGYVEGRRTENVLSPAAYIKRMAEPRPLEFPRTPATIGAKKISRQLEMQETMMMGLRLLQEGVSQSRFADRFGEQLRDVFPAEIEKFLKAGLLEWGGADKDQLRLTRRGCLLGNQVFKEFV